MAALIELYRHDAAERRAWAYAADMPWLIAGRLSRGRFEMRAPSEILRESFEEKPQDTRTGKQIIADLAEKFRSEL